MNMTDVNRFGFVGSAHIHPPIAQVPIATGDTFSAVPGISVNSMFNLSASA
jgi:hypothetical protein